RGSDVTRVAKWCQLDEEYSALEVVQRSLGAGNRQPRFAATARPRKRQQANIVAQQTPVDGLQVVLASDQWRRLWTQIVTDSVASRGRLHVRLPQPTDQPSRRVSRRSSAE